MTKSFNKAFPYTVLSGQTNGPACIGTLQYEDMVSILLQSPAVLAETGTIQINSQMSAAGVPVGAWAALQDDTGADLTIPAATKSRFYPQLVGSVAFRIVLGVAAASDRTFTVSGPWTT